MAMRSEQPVRKGGHFPNVIEKYVTDSAVHTGSDHSSLNKRIVAIPLARISGFPEAANHIDAAPRVLP
jgi:hypothetical protein